MSAHDMAEIIRTFEDPYRRVAEILFPGNPQKPHRQAAKVLLLWHFSADCGRIRPAIDALSQIEGLYNEQLTPEHVLADFIRMFDIGLQATAAAAQQFQRRIFALEISDRLRFIEDPKWVRDFGHSHKDQREQLALLNAEEKDDLLRAYWSVMSDILAGRPLGAE